MNNLTDVFLKSMYMQPGDQNQYLDSELPIRAKEMGLRVWKPGDPIQNVGRRILVGVADWVREELELVDALYELPDRKSQLEIFFLRDVVLLRKNQSPSDFDLYIPGIGGKQMVYKTPSVGIWLDGVLEIKASGAQAKRILKNEINGGRLD